MMHTRMFQVSGIGDSQIYIMMHTQECFKFSEQEIHKYHAELQLLGKFYECGFYDCLNICMFRGLWLKYGGVVFKLPPALNPA